jgi:hypothetical protein
MDGGQECDAVRVYNFDTENAIIDKEMDTNQCYFHTILMR